MKIQPAPLFRVERAMHGKPGLVGLDKLVESGDVCSYARQDDELVIFARTAEGAKKVQELEMQPPRTGQALSKRVREFLVPSDICAPEYAAFRGWQLAGAVLCGVIGFMTTAVYLDSLKASFSSSEQAAMAGVITGTLGKVTQMGGWALSRVGDNDPKKGFLTSGLVASLNTVAALGLLAVMPGAHLPVYCTTTVTGTLANIVGGAAGVNIANHLAPGNNKGEVSTKNGNQDMVAGFFGMPGGLAMSWLARTLNVNPAVLAACTLGPALLFTTVQAARALRIEPMGRGGLEKAVDAHIAGAALPEVEKKGFWATAGSLFKRRPAEAESTIRWTDRIDEVPANFSLFKDEKYLLGVKDGQVRVAFREGAGAEEAVRATVHGRLVEMGLKSGWGKTPEDLIELTKRAVPQGMSETLARKGWRITPSSLGMKTIQASWAGAASVPAAAPLTIDEVKAKLAA